MKKRTQIQKRWQPLVRASIIPPSEEKVAAFRQAAIERGADPDEVERKVRTEVDRECWRNDLYTVIVERRSDRSVEQLSIRRNDRGPNFPWRDLQRMKSQIAGDEQEGVELFPAESRLLDTANQRWIWCLPRGQRFPFGFNGPRNVSGPEEARAVGARQAALS